MNLFDKDFFKMSTGFALVVVVVLAFISFVGRDIAGRQTAAPAAVGEIVSGIPMEVPASLPSNSNAITW